MKNKRQQLELAAKAAGLHFDPTRHGNNALVIMRPGERGQSAQVLWDPINDDADSRWLQVTLRLSVIQQTSIGTGTAVAAAAGWDPDDYKDTSVNYADCEGGAYEATRLAVFKAAVIIGQNLLALENGVRP